jgi:hypothetical protein
VVAKFREKLAVNKQRALRFHMERLKIKKLKEVEGIKGSIALRSQIF